jgi:hypothetical protein
MPRYKGLRSKKRTSAIQLNEITEFAMTEWGGIPIDEMQLNFQQMETAMATFGDKVETAFIKQMPGQRPFCSYATGKVETPPLRRQPYEQDVPYQTRDGVLHGYYAYFQTEADEFEFLCKAGVVEGQERTKAKQRFAKDERHTYRSMFREPETKRDANNV